MNVYRAPRSVMTCIVAFWSFGMMFAGPVHAQAPLKLLKLDSAPSTSAVCDPATNAAAVAEARQALEKMNKWISATKLLGFAVVIPPLLSGAIDRLNSGLDAMKMGVDLAEAAGQADNQVLRLVADKRRLCDVSSPEDGGAVCLATIERQWMVRNVNAVLNWDNPGSVIRRAVDKWLGSKCDPKDAKEVCVNQCRDDMDKDKSEAKCKLLYEADGSCTPKSAVTYRQCVVNTCNATIAAKEVVQPPQPVIAQPAQPVRAQSAQPTKPIADKKEIAGGMTCTKNCETKLNIDRAAECTPMPRRDLTRERQGPQGSGDGPLACNLSYDTQILLCIRDECSGASASAPIACAAKCATQPQFSAVCERMRRSEANTTGAYMREETCNERGAARRAECVKKSCSS